MGDLPERVMITMDAVGFDLIVVTGPRGSGKTVVSRFLAYVLGLPTRNVGDALLRELRASYGLTLQLERRNIGPAFFQHATLSDYLTVLERLTGTPCILDGVRLVAGVEHLRRTSRLLHIHCHYGRDAIGVNLPPSEPYRDEILQLAESADYHLKRFNDLPSVERRIRMLLELLQEISSAPKL